MFGSAPRAGRLIGLQTATPPVYLNRYVPHSVRDRSYRYTRHANRTEEVDNHQGEPDDRTHLSD